jgi:hypothetical protein
MEKITLFKKISIIHAIKCNKTSSFEMAVQSFDDLSSLKSQLLNSELSELATVSSSVIEWQSNKPSVSEEELNEFLKRISS